MQWEKVCRLRDHSMDCLLCVREVKGRSEKGEDVGLHVSYMEIYQDTGYDLLNPGERSGALMVTLPKVHTHTHTHVYDTCTLIGSTRCMVTWTQLYGISSQTNPRNTISQSSHPPTHTHAPTHPPTHTCETHTHMYAASPTIRHISLISCELLSDLRSRRSNMPISDCFTCGKPV